MSLFKAKGGKVSFVVYKDVYKGGWGGGFLLDGYESHTINNRTLENHERSEHAQKSLGNITVGDYVLYRMANHAVKSPNLFAEWTSYKTMDDLVDALKKDACRMSNGEFSVSDDDWYDVVEATSPTAYRSYVSLCYEKKSFFDPHYIWGDKQRGFMRKYGITKFGMREAFRDMHKY